MSREVWQDKTSETQQIFAFYGFFSSLDQSFTPTPVFLMATRAICCHAACKKQKRKGDGRHVGGEWFCHAHAKLARAALPRPFTTTGLTPVKKKGKNKIGPSPLSPSLLPSPLSFHAIPRDPVPPPHPLLLSAVAPTCSLSCIVISLRSLFVDSLAAAATTMAPSVLTFGPPPVPHHALLFLFGLCL